MLLRHHLDQGSSKSALARRLGVSRDTIHRWIRDGDLDRDLDTILVQYGPRAPVATKLDTYKPIIEAQLAPVAADSSASTVVGTPVRITPSATDVDTCELAFAVAQAPASGALGPIEDEACMPGTPNRDTARVTYTPEETGTYTFTYTAYDGSIHSAPATVTVHPPPADALSVDAIQPNVIGQSAGTMTFVITGTGFAPARGHARDPRRNGQGGGRLGRASPSARSGCPNHGRS
jgi:hypothetical protein